MSPRNGVDLQNIIQELSTWNKTVLQFRGAFDNDWFEGGCDTAPDTFVHTFHSQRSGSEDIARKTSSTRSFGDQKLFGMGNPNT